MTTKLLRILLVTDHYPPHIGGAHLQAFTLANELAVRGHTVRVATSWQPGLPNKATQRIADREIQVHRIRDIASRRRGIRLTIQHSPPPYADPEAVFRLRRVIRAFRPDIIHAYGWLTYSARAALIGLNIPLLISQRDYGHVCALRTLVRDGAICSGPARGKCMVCATHSMGPARGVVATIGVLGSRGWLIRRTSGMHSVSRFVATVMQTHLIRSNAVPVQVVIPSFQTPAMGDLDSEILGSLPNEPYILYVGALRKIKGVEVLYDAYEELGTAVPLVVMGARTREKLRPPPQGVVVVFDASPATVSAAWEGALFGVAPSAWAEPLGNVVHEAMSHGKAVIGTVPGGHRDLITDGVDGLLVPAGQIEPLRVAIRALVESPDLAASMGRAARVRARGLTAREIVPRFEMAYREVLAQQDPSVRGQVMPSE